MHVWKLVSGILCIVFCLAVLFQSCAAGIDNTLSNNGEVSGSAGLLVAILLLAGGIVSIATRYSYGKGGNIALIILFGIGAFLGFSLSGSYTDLKLWSAWCLLCVVMAIVSMVKNREYDEEEDDE